MTSKVEICNLALGKVGAERITSLDNPQTENEQICATFYPIVLNKMLEVRDWSFLIRRATLDTPLLDPPDWGYSKAFLLPAFTQRVIDVRNDTFDGYPNNLMWLKEGDKIVTDSDKVYIRYVTNNIESSSLSAAFIMAFAIELAHQYCIQITENKGLKDALMMEADKALTDAAASDGQQGRHEQTFARSLQDARRGNGSNIRGKY